MPEYCFTSLRTKIPVRITKQFDRPFQPLFKTLLAFGYLALQNFGRQGFPKPEMMAGMGPDLEQTAFGHLGKLVPVQQHGMLRCRQAQLRFSHVNAFE